MVNFGIVFFFLLHGVIADAATASLDVVVESDPKTLVAIGDQIAYNVTFTLKSGHACAVTVGFPIPKYAEYVPNSMSLERGGARKSITDSFDSFNTGMYVAAMNQILVVVTNVKAEQPTSLHLKAKALVEEKLVATGWIQWVEEGVSNFLVSDASTIEVVQRPHDETTWAPSESPPEEGSQCSHPIRFLNNGGFEEPKTNMPVEIVHQSKLGGWQSTGSRKEVALWKTGSRSVKAYNGAQFVAMALVGDGVRQPIEIPHAGTYYWAVAHRGGNGVDHTLLTIVGQEGMQTVKETLHDDIRWKLHQGIFRAQNPGRAQISLVPLLSGNGSEGFGNFIDGIRFGKPACLEVEVLVDETQSIGVGSEVPVIVNITNFGNFDAHDVLLKVNLPSEVEYLPNTMYEVMAPHFGPLTDLEGDDAGSVLEEGGLQFAVCNLKPYIESGSGLVMFKVKMQKKGRLVIAVRTTYNDGVSEGALAVNSQLVIVVL